MEREYAEYLLQKTKEDYNLIAEDFSRTRNRFWEELEFLKNYTFDGEKVLDLGCGNGRLLEIFKDKRIEYFGVDVSEKLIEIAKRKYLLLPRPPEHKDKKERFLPIVKFLVTNALSLPFPNNFFDKIFCIAVFNHIPSIEYRLKFLEESKRTLKPEGQLILVVWDLWQWWGLKLLLKYSFLKLIGKSKLDFKDVFVPWGKTCQRYIHFFTKKELIEIAKKVDFEIKEVKILRGPRAKSKNIFLLAQK